MLSSSSYMDGKQWINSGKDTLIMMFDVVAYILSFLVLDLLLLSLNNIVSLWWNNSIHTK